MHSPGRTAASLHVVTAALACCSCTIRPLQGVLVPTSETFEAVSQVPILVGTTRTRSSSDPGEMFSRELSNEMAFGQVTVSIPPDHARATRVGDINPDEEPYRSEIAQQKILVFDLTHLGGDDSHSRAFDEVSTVMGMLERRLAKGQQLGEDTSRTASAR